MPRLRARAGVRDRRRADRQAAIRLHNPALFNRRPVVSRVVPSIAPPKISPRLSMLRAVASATLAPEIAPRVSVVTSPALLVSRPCACMLPWSTARRPAVFSMEASPDAVRAPPPSVTSDAAAIVSAFDAVSSDPSVSATDPAFTLTSPLPPIVPSVAMIAPVLRSTRSLPARARTYGRSPDCRRRSASRRPAE